MTKYLELAHAMQTGVEFRQNKQDQTPKHLRVGINTAMSDMGGLVTLLIEKGVITAEEYEAAITASMQREVDSYRQHIAEETGNPIDAINLK